MKLDNVKTFLKIILGNLDKIYKFFYILFPTFCEHKKNLKFWKNNLKKDLKFMKRCGIIYR